MCFLLLLCTNEGSVLRFSPHRHKNRLIFSKKQLNIWKNGIKSLSLQHFYPPWMEKAKARHSLSRGWLINLKGNEPLRRVERQYTGRVLFILGSDKLMFGLSLPKII